ncbi:hypothetical protein BJV77DRAFT_966016 [Russula vinacea]|nr:hypothetical protein BJV77DRAFT_966016 [Russula vinacea]
MISLSLSTLTASYGYWPEDITVLKDDPALADHLQPTCDSENITLGRLQLRESENLVVNAAAGCFTFTLDVPISNHQMTLMKKIFWMNVPQCSLSLSSALPMSTSGKLTLLANNTTQRGGMSSILNEPAHHGTRGCDGPFTKGASSAASNTRVYPTNGAH